MSADRDVDASAASSAASGVDVDVPVPIEPPSQPSEEEAEDHQGEEEGEGPQDATHQAEAEAETEAEAEAEAQEDAFSSTSAPAPKAEKESLQTSSKINTTTHKNMNNVPLGIKRSPISGIWEPPDQRTLPCLRRGSYKERATLFTNKPILLTNTNITPATREVPAYVSPRSAPRRPASHEINKLVLAPATGSNAVVSGAVAHVTDTALGIPLAARAVASPRKLESAHAATPRRNLGWDPRVAKRGGLFGTYGAGGGDVSPRVDYLDATQPHVRRSAYTQRMDRERKLRLAKLEARKKVSAPAEPEPEPEEKQEELTPAAEEAPAPADEPAEAPSEAPAEAPAEPEPEQEEKQEQEEAAAAAADV